MASVAERDALCAKQSTCTRLSLGEWSPHQHTVSSGHAMTKLCKAFHTLTSTWSCVLRACATLSCRYMEQRVALRDYRDVPWTQPHLSAFPSVCLYSCLSSLTFSLWYIVLIITFLCPPLQTPPVLLTQASRHSISCSHRMSVWMSLHSVSRQGSSITASTR